MNMLNPLMHKRKVCLKFSKKNNETPEMYVLDL